MDDLKLEVKKLSQAPDRKVFDAQPQWPSVVIPSSSTSAHALADAPVESPSGHGTASSHRDVGFGSVMTWTNVPVMGKPPDPPPLPISSTLQHPPLPLHYRSPPSLTIPPRPPFPSPLFQAPSPNNLPHHPAGRLPKPPFNKFNGENPRLWRSNCEKYFHMNAVDLSLWVSVASMYLEGNAACWYESIDNTPTIATWTTFCQSLHDRFDRDQHEAFIRQLFPN